jgi:hypothetical protein
MNRLDLQIVPLEYEARLGGLVRCQPEHGNPGSSKWWILALALLALSS